MAQFQIDLEAASKAAKGNLDYYDNVHVEITDADHELVSETGHGIADGTSLDLNIAPLLDQQTTEQVSRVGTILLAIVSIAFVISFVLAIFRGSLLSTWLCINTM